MAAFLLAQLLSLLNLVKLLLLLVVLQQINPLTGKISFKKEFYILHLWTASKSSEQMYTFMGVKAFLVQ